jgi:hypothetical protein
VELQDAAAAVASTSAAPAPPPAAVYKTVKQLRLRSAAAYLPHPEKESYGGEDAHFVSNVSGGAIGVADGEQRVCWLCCSLVAAGNLSREGVSHRGGGGHVGSRGFLMPGVAELTLSLSATCLVVLFFWGGVCYMGIFAKQQWHCPPGSSRVNLISCDPPRWFAPPTPG